MGLKSFIKSTSLERQIAKDADEALELLNDQLQGEVRKRTPVETGRLKRSMTTRREKFLKYSVYTKVPYAIYMEYGTSDVQPFAMLRKGGRAVEKFSMDFMDRQLGDKLKQLDDIL